MAVFKCLLLLMLLFVAGCDVEENIPPDVLSRVEELEQIAVSHNAKSDDRNTLAAINESLTQC